MSSVVAASSAVAPAGGWTVLVKPMKAEARPTARAPATHRKFSKLEFNRNSLVMLTPIIAEKSWPRMMLRGCANGDSIALYSRIAAAPCGQAYQYTNC